MALTKDFDRLYRTLRGNLPPAQIVRGTSNAELFSNGRGFMADFDLTMQQQVGYPAGCQFCYVATAFRLAPTDIQRNWGFEVRTKTGATAKARSQLERGALADKTVYWSGVTDPYAASPVLTRDFWQALSDQPPERRPRRIVVQSRFRPDRDAALMSRYCATTHPTDQGPAVVVSYSIGTDRNDLIRAWEHATPTYESRLQALRSLHDADIFTVATLSPFGLWRNLTDAVRCFDDAGVAYLTILFFKERTGATTTPRLFLDYLRSNHPELLDPGWQAERLNDIRSIVGRRVLVGQPGFASLARPHDFLSSLNVVDSAQR
jgi:DNA repair photolyase